MSIYGKMYFWYFCSYRNLPPYRHLSTESVWRCGSLHLHFLVCTVCSSITHRSRLWFSDGTPFQQLLWKFAQASQACKGAHVLKTPAICIKWAFVKCLQGETLRISIHIERHYSSSHTKVSAKKIGKKHKTVNQEQKKPQNEQLSQLNSVQKIQITKFTKKNKVMIWYFWNNLWTKAATSCWNPGPLQTQVSFTHILLMVSVVGFMCYKVPCKC